MVKGWLRRIMRPKENTPEEVVWRGRAARDAANYMAETVDAQVEHLLARMALAPDDPNVALVLKGEGRHLYLWVQGMKTAIQAGEAAGK